MSGPRGASLRPTSDMVREALFSILGPRVIGRRFLDLYAGTGAVGIEALSRGADTATFVESNPSIVALLRNNLDACRLVERSSVWVGRTATFLDRLVCGASPYSIVFADPPYAARREIEVLSGLSNPGLLADDAVVVIEQASTTESPKMLGPAMLTRRYEYGDTVLVLYQCTRNAQVGSTPK